MFEKVLFQKTYNYVSVPKFPIDDNTKWINWFNQFVGMEYMAERVIYNTFGNKEIY